MHVIHWAQDPTPFVNIHHGHFTVQHGPCTSFLTRQQVLIWQAKSAGNVHTVATAAKTMGIFVAAACKSVDLPQTLLSNSAVLLLPQAGEKN